MKILRNILIILMFLSSIGIASAQPTIVDSKIIWSENNFLGFTWGDYIEEVTFSDGYVKNIMHRSQWHLLEIADVPRVTVSQGDSNIPVKFTLRGMRCSFTSYSIHVVNFYVGTAGSSAPIAHQAMGTINCENLKTYTVNVPAGNLLATARNFDLVMEETSYNAAATTFVTETRMFNVVVSPATTPIPTPTPSDSGKLTITSNPTGASIRVNTQYRGVTPITINLPTGDYRVEASKSGYQTQLKTLSVYPGYSVDLSYILTPTPVVTTPVVTTPVVTTPVVTTPVVTTPGIRQCSDGTLYGQCSTQKPFFCYYGTMVIKAQTCGCPTGQTPSGESCIAVTSTATGTPTATATGTPAKCLSGYVYDPSTNICVKIQTSQGFDSTLAIIAVVGIIATAYIILRRKK